MQIPASNVTDYRRYQLDSSIKEKITWKVKNDVENFFNGEYSNIDEVRKNALEIISNYSFESATYRFFQKMQKEDSWKLETEEQRVERRSSMVHAYFSQVAEKARIKAANRRVYYDMKPIARSSGPGVLPSESYYNAKMSEDSTRVRSPVSVINSDEITQESRPTSPPSRTVFESVATVLSKEEINEDIAELAEEIYKFNQYLLKKLESTDDVNAQLHVSDMAKKKLRDITRYMEKLSSSQYFIIFDELIKRDEYTQLVRFTGKKI